MDALDMRLLRVIGRTPFAGGTHHPDVLKPSRLAEAVGTTRQTVEARLARLEEMGVLAGYTLWPNLRHLDLHWDIYHWKVHDDQRKGRAFEALPLERGIVGVFSFLGPDLCVDVRWANEEDRARTLSLVSEATGTPTPFTLLSREMPPVAAPLTPLDWRIVRALRHNARRPLEEVAAETGVSLRTVKRRLEKMSRERAFDVTGNIALERAPRPIPLAVLFHFTPEGGKATATALLRAFDDRCLTAWVPPSAELGHYDMMLYAESTGEIESIRARAEAVPGVARVEILLYTGAKMDESWLDREIDRRLEPALRA